MGTSLCLETFQTPVESLCHVIMNHDDTYIKQRSTALQVMKTYMRHLDFPTMNSFTTLIFLLTFMFMYTYYLILHLQI